MNRSVKWSVIIFLSVVGVYSYLRSDTFTIEEIKVVGNRSLSKDCVISESSVSPGTNIFALAAGEVVERLERNSMIARAVVKRRLPDTVILEIQERTPICMISTEKGLYYLGEDGTVLGLVGQGIANMPVVVGLGSDIAVGTSLEGLTMTILNEMRRWGSEVWPRLSEINMQDTQDISAFTVDVIHVHFGDGTDLQKKMQILATILRKEEGIEEVDLTFPETPVVKKR